MKTFPSQSHTHTHTGVCTKPLSNSSFQPSRYSSNINTGCFGCLTKDHKSHHSTCPYNTLSYHISTQHSNMLTQHHSVGYYTCPLSLLGTENDLNGVRANSQEWFLLTAYLQCVQLRQELESGFSHKLDGVLIEMAARNQRPICLDMLYFIHFVERVVHEILFMKCVRH